MPKTVVGIFEKREDAENAARMIKENGFRTEDISIVAKEQDGQNGGRTTNINDNISDGVVTGGILGGLAGILIGAGSMMIPGFGIVAAAGPITGLLSGAVTGGIVGGLIDLGIPERRGSEYEANVKEGKILFTMRTEDENVERVTGILKDCGATRVESY